MTKYQQAPVIKNIGDKFQKDNGMGKAIRNHSLEEAIACGLGERDFAAYKVMMFLTGNAEGFAVAEKTICERCNIGETAYKKARKKLAEMGWIIHEQGKTIAVNYNKIMGYSEYTPEENIEKEGYSQYTPQGYSNNTPLGYSENTHNNIRDNINKEDNIEISIKSSSLRDSDLIDISSEGEKESITELLNKGVDKEALEKAKTQEEIMKAMGF